MKINEISLFLVGFMGAGKSFVGRRLAEQLQLEFLDLDQWIVERNQQSIPEIFAQRGEAGFREAEREALHHLPKEGGLLVASGGGTPCFFDNMDWMNGRGVTIFLDASIDLLVDRLLPEMEHRPLLAGKSEVELRQFLEAKLEERRPFYEKAQVRYHLATGEEAVVEELRHELLNIIGH